MPDRVAERGLLVNFVGTTVDEGTVWCRTMHSMCAKHCENQFFATSPPAPSEYVAPNGIGRRRSLRRFW